MLRPNRFRDNMTAWRQSAALPSQHAALHWPAVVNRVEGLGRLAGVPSGYATPQGGAVAPAITAGRMATYRSPTVQVSATAVGALGRNMEASAVVSLAASAVGGLIASGAAVAVVSIDATGQIQGAIKGSASGSVTINATAAAAGLGHAAAAAVVSVDAAGQPMGLGYMAATTEETGALTPAAIARAVWDYLAAQGDAQDTMGEKLNAAGSAANPWTDPVGQALVERVRELFELAGLDPTKPMTVTREGRTAGTIVQAIRGDGQNSTTVERVS